MSDIERFNDKVFVVPDGCWLWCGSIHANGYGKFRFDGDIKYAHRVAYVLFVGVIPDGLVIDHLCRKRSCVNPSHLEPVTRGENTRRGLPTNSVCVHGVGLTRCNDGCAKDKRNEAVKRWREKNPDYHKNWREKNPNYFKEYNNSRRSDS